MPTDTIVVLVSIVAVFGFFMGIVAYGDLTWRR
jgi:hypothetical protein